MRIKRISVKKAGIKPSLYRQIRQHALCSFYRLNAKSSKYYTFTVDNDGKSWSGGWSWLDHPLTIHGDLAIGLSDGKLYLIGE